MVRAKSLPGGFKFSSYNREDGFLWRRVREDNFADLVNFYKEKGILSRPVLIVTLNQDKIFTADITNRKMIYGSGLVGDIKGVAVSMVSADCAPLILIDKVSGAWAFVHINWYGAVSGQAARAVREMIKKFGTKPENIVGAIGPKICADCYIQNGWRGLFKILFYYIYGRSRFIKKTEQGKGLDLRAGILDSLAQAGVIKERVEDLSICTCHDGWPSHAREGQGRQSSLLSVLEIN